MQFKHSQLISIHLVQESSMATGPLKRIEHCKLYIYLYRQIKLCTDHYRSLFFVMHMLRTFSFCHIPCFTRCFCPNHPFPQLFSCSGLRYAPSWRSNIWSTAWNRCSMFECRRSRPCRYQKLIHVPTVCMPQMYLEWSWLKCLWSSTGINFHKLKQNSGLATTNCTSLPQELVSSYKSM